MYRGGFRGGGGRGVARADFFFLKAALAPIYTNFEGERASRFSKKNFDQNSVFLVLLT